LKAAFDRVNREAMWEDLRKKGISEGLVERIEEIYNETKSRVKIGKKLTKEFWIERGVRQGCPLSPLLFILFIADIEEFMRKRQEGGTTIGNKRIFTLAYADDLAMLAETRKEMERMLTSLENYLDKKKLELNSEKSKILIFQKEEETAK